MVPQYVTAGDSLSLRQALAAYPASAWVLKLRLVGRNSGDLAVTFTADGEDHVATVAAASTAALPPGPYGWTAWVENTGTGAVTTVAMGQTEVRPDPRTAGAGTDLRSTAQRALDDARAAFAAWSPTTRSYTINGRSMTFNTPAEIIQLIGYWQREVQREQAADAIAAGAGTRRGKVFVRLGRA